ncbi:MAG: hypothetical protein Q9217_005235 [Psora testacea]
MSTAGLIFNSIALFAAYFIPSTGDTWWPKKIILTCKISIASIIVVKALYFILRNALQRISTSRRNLIRQAVNRDQEAFEAGEKLSQKSEGDDWVNVQSDRAKSAKNGRLKKNDYCGFIGFFHPFANAGGGGERVLWAAIRATQVEYPNAICVIYTGDHGSGKTTILERVKSRFDIDIHAPTLVFLYLGKRDWIVAGSWPRFTLLLQSLGSIIVAHEALSLLTPDVFIDTMGYSFSTWYCKVLFLEIAIGSYVHYPFIGTHMVHSLAADSGQGVNAGTGKGLRGWCKKLYWHALLKLYTWTGTSIDVVMTNSSWTQAHMQRIWGPNRRRARKLATTVLYPPVSVEEIIERIPLDGPDAMPREKILLCIAQFRPEKNHELLIQSFAQMAQAKVKGTEGARLVLIGSVRDDEDQTLVYKLRLLVKELKVDDSVVFRINSTWSEILDWLRRSWIGVNGMWCEHFGIGVVEYQAAGLICVVNDSGGPKEDIVIECEGGPTGYRASTVQEYAVQFTTALTLAPSMTLTMRKRNRESSKRFTTDIFASQWTQRMKTLIDISRQTFK